MWLPAQLFSKPSSLEWAAEAVKALYLRHLGEQADGQRQREAERNQANKAVDGQHQSAIGLQETESTEDNDKWLHDRGVWINPRCLLQLFLAV